MAGDHDAHLPLGPGLYLPSRAWVWRSSRCWLVCRPARARRWRGRPRAAPSGCAAGPALCRGCSICSAPPQRGQAQAGKAFLQVAPVVLAQAQVVQQVAGAGLLPGGHLGQCASVCRFVGQHVLAQGVQLVGRSQPGCRCSTGCRRWAWAWARVFWRARPGRRGAVRGAGAGRGVE